MSNAPKICSKCGNVKSMKSWGYTRCDSCYNAAVKKWRNDNPEKQKKIAKEYRKNNKEKVKDSLIKWAKNNKDKISEWSKRYYNNNKEKILLRQKEKRTYAPREVISSDERVIKQKEQQKKYYEKNKEARTEYSKNYNALHKEYKLEYQKEWSKSNPEKVKANIHSRRARIYGNGGEYTAQEWRDLCDRYGNRCLACGATGKLSVDHVIPISKGGSNSIDNLQPLCKSCNSSKGTKTIDYRGAL